jgi:drug/metabolite transporter (DMT)-like permease
MTTQPSAALHAGSIDSFSGHGYEQRQSRLTGYALALAAGAMWGTTGLMSELLSRGGVEVTAIGFWRVLLATLGFLVYGAFRPALFRVDRRGLLLAGGVGGVLVALFELAFQFGFKHLGVAPTVALLYTAPVMITLLAGPLLGERITPLRLLLAALTTAGAVLAVTGGEGIKPTGNLWIGLAGGLGAAVSYAGTTLLARYTVPRYGSERVLFLEIAGGTIVLALVLPLVGKSPVAAGWVPAWMHAPTAWVQVVALGIVTVVLANFAFFGAAKRIDAAPTAVGASCEPVVGALLALAFLGQNPGVMGWIGLALVVCGVAGGYLREGGEGNVDGGEAAHP